MSLDGNQFVGFTPTCSAYMQTGVRDHGALKVAILGLKRICANAILFFDVGNCTSHHLTITELNFFIMSQFNVNEFKNRH